MIDAGSILESHFAKAIAAFEKANGHKPRMPDIPRPKVENKYLREITLGIKSGATRTEVARHLGISANRVSQIATQHGMGFTRQEVGDIYDRRKVRTG